MCGAGALPPVCTSATTCGGTPSCTSSCSPTTSRAVASCPSTAPASRGSRPRRKTSRCSCSEPCSTPRSTNSRRWRGTRREDVGAEGATAPPRRPATGMRFGKSRRGTREGASGRGWGSAPAAPDPSRGSPCPITSRWRRACATRCGAAARWRCSTWTATTPAVSSRGLRTTRTTATASPSWSGTGLGSRRTRGGRSCSSSGRC
mmetsp:Transcript_10897/g.45375  ORF Transcript_10897/g.45375 Transcript_10897/m.45375 type:complete len:204 (-) Transcript_10897:2368-2979(-)